MRAVHPPLRQRRAISRRALISALPLILALGAAHLALPQAAGPPATSPVSLLAQAQAQVRAGALAPAEQTVRAFLKLEPASPDGAYLLAHLLQQGNHARESLEWFTKAAAERTPSAEDLRSVALDYVLLDDYPDAQRWLQRALRSDPQDAEAWYDLARVHMMQQNFAAAEQALERTLLLQPRLVKAEDNLGVTYEAENRAEDALAAYRQAIRWQQSAPHPSEQPLLNLGALLLTQQRPEEAVGPLSEAVKIAPRNVKAHEQLARASEQTGNPTQAQQQMEEAVRLDPGNPRLHYELGLILRRAGKPDLAREQMTLSGELYGTHSTPER